MFTLEKVQKSEELDEIVDEILSSGPFMTLAAHNVTVKAIISPYAYYKDIPVNIRKATTLERHEFKADIIVEVEPTYFENTDKHEKLIFIAHLIYKVSIFFVKNGKPAIKIDDSKLEGVSEELLSFYGSDNRIYGNLSKKFKKAISGINTKKRSFNPMG